MFHMGLPREESRRESRRSTKNLGRDFDLADALRRTNARRLLCGYCLLLFVPTASCGESCCRPISRAARTAGFSECLYELETLGGRRVLTAYFDLPRGRARPSRIVGGFHLIASPTMPFFSLTISNSLGVTAISTYPFSRSG